jgi:hypothetical protein
VSVRSPPHHRSFVRIEVFTGCNIYPEDGGNIFHRNFCRTRKYKTRCHKQNNIRRFTLWISDYPFSSMLQSLPSTLFYCSLLPTWSESMKNLLD